MPLGEGNASCIAHVYLHLRERLIHVVTANRNHVKYAQPTFFYGTTRVFVELKGLWGGINPTIRKQESNNVVILSRAVTHGTYVDKIQME